MDEFTIFFDTTSLLKISLDVHVYILSQCWQLLWAMGDMCNVNMCIMSCRQLCSVGSQKSSFIIARGVGMMKFIICQCALKPLDSNDNTSHCIYMKSVVIFSFIKLAIVARTM
jgi:hypothetical protein